VAWSNDAFELWVLLHFEDIDTTDINCEKRTFYYDKLTNIFLQMPKPNADLTKVQEYLKSRGYKEMLKSKNNFLNIVRPSITPHTYTAINRAKDLEK
jgi:hypothetical protein